MALMVLTSFAIMTSGHAAAQGLGSESGSSTDAGTVASNANAAIDPMSKLDSVLAKRVTESRGPYQVYVIVNDRTSVNEFLAANGLPLVSGKEMPGLPTTRLLTLDAKQITALAAVPGVSKIMIYEKPAIEPSDINKAIEVPQAELRAPGAEDLFVDSVHGAMDAWDDGWVGTDVKIAIIDTGMDMSHPDLQNSQARYSDSSSPYFGWPIAYDDIAADAWSQGQIGGWVADTSYSTRAYGDYVYFDGMRYKVAGLTDVDGDPLTSVSGIYHIGYHTDANLASLWGESIAVLVVDANAWGVYDTVYVDVTDDYDFTNDKACTWGDEISYFDFFNYDTGTEDWSKWNGGDGYADLAGGMVYWISDGSHVLPGSNWTYGATWTPSSGSAVAFVGEFSLGESHGTMTSSAALARPVSAGGLLAGMAWDAQLIAIPFNGDTINDWKFAELGADGLPNTGDEADIVSNSYGWSDTAIDAGYEYLDMMAGNISLYGAYTLWCWSSGNGGPGYGTTHSITDFSSIHVGAGTTMMYRALLGYENDLSYTKWGDVIPFSNSGPTREGKLNSEIIASGAYSLEPMPLNEWDNSGNIGDGSLHYQLGSGTSHASPTVAGGAALGYNAYMVTWGGKPRIDYAKAYVMSAADDMHFDPFKQGAGWLNAHTLTDLMSEAGSVGTMALPGISEPVFAKSALYPGFVYGTRAETQPMFLLPGQTDNTHVFYTANNDVVVRNVDVTSELLLKTGSDLLQFTTADTGSIYEDVTALVPATTDLLKVTMFMNLSAFDPELDYVSNVQYWLELQDWVDENGDGQLNVTGGEWELYRYSVDGSDCNYNQVMIKDPIDRTTDGLIVRIRAIDGMAGLDISLQLDYYELSTFPWVSFTIFGSGDPLTPSLSMVMAPGIVTAWTVDVTVPLGTPVGTYEAAIYVRDGVRTQCIPVVINVPAATYEFDFGGPSLFDTPYNNDFTGIADKGWRFEVGDWRMYWSMPDPMEPIPMFGWLITSVQWTELPTDVNVHVLAPESTGTYWFDALSQDPSLEVPMFTQFDWPFGLGFLEVPIADSNEMYMGAGIFGVGTNTGGPKEVLAAPLAEYASNMMSDLGVPGPFAILTRCPVMSGSSPFDTIIGSTKWIQILGPDPAVISIDILKPGNIPLTDKIPAMYAANIPVGSVDVLGGGIGPMSSRTWSSQYISQDILTGDFVSDLANAVYTRAIVVQDTSMLTVSIEPIVSAPDLDLGLWLDVNENGIAELDEPYWYVGISGSYESLSLSDPANGVYLVKVLGYSVGPYGGLFDLTISKAIAGAALLATDLEPTITGGAFHGFNVSYSLPAIAGTYTGRATFGFMGASDMWGVDVVLNVIDNAAPVIENVSPDDGAVLASDVVTITFDVNDLAAPDSVYSGLDPYSVEIVVDNAIDWASFASIAGDHVAVTLPFTLPQGDHTLVIFASDMYGNDAEPVMFMFTVNSVIETFTAEFADPTTTDVIPDGTTVALDHIILQGVTDPLADVTISAPDDMYVTIADPAGDFMVDVNLNEGVNVFTIVTTNDAGISETMYKTIISDTICILTVNAIESPVAQADVAISGMTEMGASVTVDGDAATVDSTGVWSVDVTLSEGANALTVEATDAVGNTNTVTVDIVLDTTAPTLSVTAPADGTHVSEASVVVTGTTEAGAMVYVDGVLAEMVSTTGWEAMVVLAEGSNTVTVTAQDALGNSVSMTLEVIYDPPYATPDDLNNLQNQLQDVIDQLNDTLQQDLSDEIGNTDARIDDTNSFASMLLYLMIGLFAVAIVMIVVVWYTLNGKIGGGKSEGHSMEEVSDEPGPPSDVEKEFEQLEKEIDKEGR
jgi:hypothetical protein